MTGRYVKRFFDGNQEVVETNITGGYLLNDPLYNKGTAFTDEERDAFTLHGHLPFHVSSIEEQVHRRYENFSAKGSDIEKFAFLYSLQNRNEVLYYRLVHEHIEEMLPYIYTPTVGKASINYSYIYNQVRGIYLNYPQRHQIDAILDSVHKEHVDVIVVTDGSRILGLGDLGVGGMVIPVGKLALYTLFGGVHPGRTLPLVLDVGTNNQELLEDPYYIGWKHPRVDGKAYYDFLDQVVTAIRKRFPNVLFQWEDFQKNHADTLLEKYRKEICSFNDDIQGTAAVALAAIIKGLKKANRPLLEERFVIVGGGSAGMGIADLLAMALQEAGAHDPYKNICIIDRHGLIRDGGGEYDEKQKKYIKPRSFVSDPDLLTVVKETRAGTLIGVSGQGGLFTKEVVTSIAHDTPLIFPLSNPSSCAEATPQDIVSWTKGRAIIATGSPFDPVAYGGKLHTIAQCNNVYIFPAVGLAAITCDPKYIPDSVFLRAAKTLAATETEGLFPRFTDIRSTMKEIAHELVLFFKQEMLAQKDETIDENMWFPEYPKYIKK